MRFTRIALCCVSVLCSYSLSTASRLQFEGDHAIEAALRLHLRRQHERRREIDSRCGRAGWTKSEETVRGGSIRVDDTNEIETHEDGSPRIRDSLGLRSSAAQCCDSPHRLAPPVSPLLFFAAASRFPPVAPLILSISLLHSIHRLPAKFLCAVGLEFDRWTRRPQSQRSAALRPRASAHVTAWSRFWGRIGADRAYPCSWRCILLLACGRGHALCFRPRRWFLTAPSTALCDFSDSQRLSSAVRSQNAHDCRGMIAGGRRSTV